jgi:hypothetical protein
MSRTMTTTTALLFGIVGLAMVGCGTASEAATDAVDAVDETRTTSLAGSWTSDSGERRPATLIVEQRALSAKMILTLDGHICLSESVIEAQVTIPEGVKTTADVAGMRLEIEGKPDFEDVVGNFEAIAGGPCPGQGGWMQFKN